VPVVFERPRPVLTPTEYRIADLICKGMKNREAAAQLGKSEQVIKNYLAKVFKKTGVDSRIELALLWQTEAFQAGLKAGESIPPQPVTT
jgi:DNA-binding NarL/FixJ family response regulator